MTNYFHWQTTVLCLLTSIGVAQPVINFEEIKAKNPSEDLYDLRRKEHLVFDIRNNKLEITSKKESEVLFLSDKASLLSAHSVYYFDEMEEIPEIKATSYIPDDRKYKKIEVENIYTRKPVKEGVFFDDFKEKYFFYPGVKAGAIGALSYTQKLKDPHFLGTFYFGNYIPVKEAEYSVTFPSEVVVKYVLHGDPKNIQFKQTVSKGKTTYTWHAADIKSIPNEPNAPDLAYYAPHVMVYVDQYILNGKVTKVLSDVRELHSWYYWLVKDVNKKDDPGLHQLTDSLIKGIANEEEKIKKIYYWVQNNVKYIAFEEGLGGFVPREASLIYSRGYGDCKDKSSILVTMLRYAGIPAYLTWVGTRDIPYLYSEIPSPQVDNHMIASVNRNNKWIFLDGTQRYLPYGLPSGFIQGKEALISISADSFLIEKIPIVEKEKNFRWDSLNVFIDGNELKGSGQSLFSGMEKNETVNDYFYVSHKEKMEEMKNMFLYGNHKCLVDSLNYEGFDDYSDTLKYEYRFTIPDFIRKVDQKIFVNMNLSKTLGNDFINIDKRKTDRENQYKYIQKLSAILKIPSGYSVSKIPDNSSYDNALFGYTVNYKQYPDRIVMEKKIYVDTLTLSVSKFNEWNSLISSLSEACSQVVVFEKK